jgi:hypothetical protein
MTPQAKVNLTQEKSITQLLLEKQRSKKINPVNEGRAIRKILSGCSIIEYGINDINDETKGELKMRANNAVKWAKLTMRLLIGHPNANPAHIDKLADEYHSDRNALLSELYDTVEQLNDEDLVFIIESIKANIDEHKTITTTNDSVQ